MTWVKTAILSAVGVVLLLGIVLGGYYAADGSVEADVVEKKCSDGGGGGGGGLVGLPGGTQAPVSQHNAVTVRTTFPFPGLEHTLTDITTEKCLLVNEGNHVRVHIRSERTSIWDRPGGNCIWDTEHGPTGCDR